MSVCKMKVPLFSLLFSLLAFCGTVAASEPHEVIESMTQDLLVNMEKYRETADENPEPFFSYLEERLGGVIDFKWIASNVMGRYRKTATDEQKQRFIRVFRRGLVETYGRGLLAYSDEKIVVLPPQGDIAGKRKVTVKQEIRSKDDVYPVAYSMGRNKKGEWKILNVIIGGVNLGKTFRNQFVQAAEKKSGDVDSVIDGWATKV